MKLNLKAPPRVQEEEREEIVEFPQISLGLPGFSCFEKKKKGGKRWHYYMRF